MSAKFLLMKKDAFEHVLKIEEKLKGTCDKIINKIKIRLIMFKLDTFRLLKKNNQHTLGLEKLCNVLMHFDNKHQVKAMALTKEAAVNKKTKSAEKTIFNLKLGGLMSKVVYIAKINMLFSLRKMGGNFLTNRNAFKSVVQLYTIENTKKKQAWEIVKRYAEYVAECLKQARIYRFKRKYLGKIWNIHYSNVFYRLKAKTDRIKNIWDGMCKINALVLANHQVFHTNFCK